VDSLIPNPAAIFPKWWSRAGTPVPPSRAETDGPCSAGLNSSGSFQPMVSGSHRARHASPVPVGTGDCTGDSDHRLCSGGCRSQLL
jgi:hypothetical protein